MISTRVDDNIVEAAAANLEEFRRRQEYAGERRFIERLHRDTPLPPAVVDPPKSGWQKTITCRRCGCTVSEPWWNFCPNCGQAIEHYTWAGGKGWNHEEAEKAFRAMMGVAGND